MTDQPIREDHLFSSRSPCPHPPTSSGTPCAIPRRSRTLVRRWETDGLKDEIDFIFITHADADDARGW